MKLIRNKLFRVILYILGFLSVVSTAIFFTATVLRSFYFADVKSMNSNYEESEYIKDLILRDLSTVQSYAKAEKTVQDIDFSDKKLEVFDYADISEEVASGKAKKISGLSKKVSAEDMLGNDAYKKMAEYTSSNGGGFNSKYTAYPGMLFPEDYKFIRLTWADYMDIVRNNCLKYSSDKYWNYSENESVKSEEREALDQLFDNLHDGGINDGDYFAMIDNDLYLFQENYGVVYYGRYGSAALPDEISPNEYIYFLYSGEVEELEDQKSLEEYILSGYIYRSDIEAVYSILSGEERTKIQNSSNVHDYYAYRNNSAYSLDGENVSRAWIYDSGNLDTIEGDSEDGYNITYDELCKRYEEDADIFVKYDAEKKELTQWYKNSKGSVVSFEYLTKDDINSLTKGVNCDFVLSINDSDFDCYNTWIKNSYNFVRNFDNTELFFIFSFVLFIICVFILILGEPAKLYKVDGVPYIIWLIFYIAIISGICIPLDALGYSSYLLNAINRAPFGTVSVAVFMLLVAYLSSAAIIMNLVRRVKSGKFLEGFLLVKIARWLKSKIKGVTGRISGNKKLAAFVGAYCIAMLIVLIYLYNLSYNESGILAVLIMIALTGAFVFAIFKYMTDLSKLLQTSKRIEAGELDAKVNVDDLTFNAKEMGESLNNLGGGLSKAVDKSLRDERTKAELITNVSHDIKTPLTSIINYVDLLKKEEINNTKAEEYINVLDQKSQRLKQLILDLIEASKTSTGNIEMECMNMNLVELLNQGLGEYEDKFTEAELELVKTFKTDNALIYADGRRVFRIIDNILNNTVKYAQKGTRVYMDLYNVDEGMVKLSVKNISKERLNISAEELTERFVRGDRSRNTEGSGLGLSIAKNLTELQKGKFDITIDGDLFKVDVAFPLVTPVVKGDNTTEDNLNKESLDKESLDKETLDKETLDKENTKEITLDKKVEELN